MKMRNYTPAVVVAPIRPQRTSLLVAWLAKEAEFVGIGNATAAKLAGAFGNSLHSILSGDNVDLLAPVIGETLSRQLISTYHEKLAEAEVIDWLEKCRFDSRLASRVVKVWGSRAIDLLCSNPYLMLTFASWPQVDRAARALGVHSLDPRRLIASVEAILYERLEEKHTHTERSQVLLAVCSLLRVGEATAQDAINQAIGDRAIVADANGLQPLGAAVMESYIAGRITELRALAPLTLFRAALGAERLEFMLQRFEAAEQHLLTAEQRAAVRMAVDHPISILTGGAGVGKTTVLKAIRMVLEEVGCHVETIALSGRAAKRISEATGRPAMTIAAFVQAMRSKRLKLSSDALVIVDESSMLDLPTLYRLMRTVPEPTRYLFVGDPYQLPPIGFGLTFHLWAETEALPTVRLTRVHRQSEQSGIPQVAQQIRQGTIPCLPSYARDADGVSFIEVPDGGTMDVLVMIIADHGMDRCQVISPLRRGPAGSEAINAYFHHLVAPGKLGINRGSVCEGEPIIWTNNDWQRGLTNGSMGRLLSVQQHSGIATVQVDDRIEEMGDRDWTSIDLAYAITVHKAQGSQFDCVLVPITHSRLLDRALLYTAITRAVRKVILIGDRAAFQHAVIAPPQSHRREVGLTLRLKLA
jgi:exodeoxyribonuclease V alpha subunit